MTNTTIEKVADTGTSIEVATAEQRRLTALYKQCASLAKSDLVPRSLRGKPDNVFALALYGEKFGLTAIHAIQRIYIIQGTFEPKAEVLAGVIIRAGHELRWDEVSPDRCTVSIRRAGTDYWQSTTWTIEQAKKAGLLDMWVERKVTKPGDQYAATETFVVGDDDGIFTDDERKRRGLGPVPDWARQQLEAGNVKRKDPWFQFPDDMLAAKALRRGGKRVAPDALLGLDDEEDVFEPLTPEKVLASTTEPAEPDPGPDDDEAAAAPAPADPDEEIEDADVVGGGETPPSAADGDDQAAAHAAAMKRLMVTCGKAFPETDAPKGTKTHRQKLVRRAAQFAVLKQHRSASDLTADELVAVETWVHRHFLDDGATVRMRYEILDGDVVRFTFGDQSKDIAPATDDEPAAA